MPFRWTLTALGVGCLWTSWSSTRPRRRPLLQLSQGNPKQEYSLGNEWVECSPREKDFGGRGGWITAHKLAMCVCSPETQSYPGMHQNKHDQQAEGGESLRLLRCHETTPGLLHPGLWTPTQERHRLLRADTEEGHKRPLECSPGHSLLNFSFCYGYS